MFARLWMLRDYPKQCCLPVVGGVWVWCGLQILSVSSSIAEISFLLRREISSSFFYSVAIVVLAFPAAMARLYLNRDLSDATRFLMLNAGGFGGSWNDG